MTDARNLPIEFELLKDIVALDLEITIDTVNRGEAATSFCPSASRSIAIFGGCNDNGRKIAISATRPYLRSGTREQRDALLEDW
jgi:hypothetical protein